MKRRRCTNHCHSFAPPRTLVAPPWLTEHLPALKFLPPWRSMSVGREKSWRQWKYLTMFGCDVWMFPSMHKNHVAVFCNVALKWRDAGKQSFFSVPELCIDCILLKIVVHTPCSGRPGSHNKVQCAMDFLFASLREKNAQIKDGFQQKKSWISSDIQMSTGFQQNVLHSKSTQCTYQIQR